MPPLERESEPFVDAFAQYLNLVNEATCDRLLYRKEKKGMPERLSAAGKMLVKVAEPSVKTTAKTLVGEVERLKKSGKLASGYGPDRYEYGMSLEKLKPCLKERGLVLLDHSFRRGSNGFENVYLGQGVKIEDGPLRSTIFTKNLVESTQNRILDGEKSEARMLGISTVSDGVCHFFETMAELMARSVWARFNSRVPEEDSWQKAKARKLAYGDLFGKFKDDTKSFGLAAGLAALTGVAIPHEFHHEKIMVDHEVSRDLREAAAHLYSLANAKAPETVFANLENIYGLPDASNDFSYANAGSKIFEYLARAGYSEFALRTLDTSDREAIDKISRQLSRQAKSALQMLERDYGLPSHEATDAELKPDFEKYAALVRDAVIERYKEVCK